MFCDMSFAQSLPSAVLYVLPADTSCYVDVINGASSNDGLTASTAKAHYQDCVVLVENSWDMGGFTAKFQGVAGQTDTVPVLIAGPFRGPGLVMMDCAGGGVTVAGSLSTFVQGPIATTGGNLGTNFQVQNCRLKNPGTWGFDLINGNAGMMISGPGMVYDTAPSAQIVADSPGALVLIAASYNIVGGSASHFLSMTGGLIEDTGGAYGQKLSITIAPELKFSYFAEAALGGNILFTATTFSGSAIGSQYMVDGNSSIYTSGGNFPGNIAGAVYNGGLYQ